jgi:predicted deacylase
VLVLPLQVMALEPEAAIDATASALPEARSVDLDQPVSNEELLESANTQQPPSETQAEPDAGEFDEPAIREGTGVRTDKLSALNPPNTLLLLGAKVPPATSTRLAWSPSQSFEGIAVPTPVLVVNGANSGPVLCLTAAIHGDELNGIEIVRRVLYNLDPQELSGAVIGVPIANLQGFRRNSRYLTDRRDLNRFFPGNPTGSSASRIAHSFFNDVVRHCDALVDLHTGSFHRTNLLQLRADLRDSDILELTHGFGSTVVLQSEGAPGTLRRAATERGIPAVTLEAGAPLRLDEKGVQQGVAGIETLLSHMNMMKGPRFWGNPEPVYYESRWVRADQGGILLSSVSLGEKVDPGELLGTVTDPITNVRVEIRSPLAGRVLGMALNQVVLPGFAAYHIGIETSDDGELPPEDSSPESTDEDVADHGVSEDDLLAE